MPEDGLTEWQWPKPVISTNQCQRTDWMTMVYVVSRLALRLKTGVGKIHNNLCRECDPCKVTKAGRKRPTSTEVTTTQSLKKLRKLINYLPSITTLVKNKIRKKLHWYAFSPHTSLNFQLFERSRSFEVIQMLNKCNVKFDTGDILNDSTSKKFATWRFFHLDEN